MKTEATRMQGRASARRRKVRPYDPRVSVIIASFNNGHFLPYTLRSIVEQTYANFEVILVDDGSSDNTSDVVSKFAEYLDIIYLKLDTNMGLAAALNVGLANATGDLIARHDSDDYMYPTRLADEVLFLVGRPDIDLVGSGVDCFDASYGAYRSPTLHKEIVDQYLVSNPFYHPTVMFRRNLIDKGLYSYDSSLFTDEDYDLWGRLLRECKCENLPWSTIKYRIHSGNNGRHPMRKIVKKQAISSFLSGFNVNDRSGISEILSEFQCSGYISNVGFDVLRDYAFRAEAGNNPKLGWIHSSILQESSYYNFAKKIVFE